MSISSDPLDLFIPPVREWFRRSLGAPTLVQRGGWPAIAAGANTLLLAPTGSGKTLAAFLACLDGLWRQRDLRRGVRILYISPLKALNNDIYRNLQLPLEGVADIARQTQFPLPKIDIAVRTGDTPTAERQRLLRHPPHVLITTPESLHLLLTSKARETLRGVTHCIVDEIHALCPNKRGVFLALLLERLQEINPQGFVRIGLSATQRPLEEVARYLGGLERFADGSYRARPVTIVNAGLRKNLDLQVMSPVESFAAIPEKTVWPAIYRLLTKLVQAHRSTIIFANNRRSVERITAHLQELLEQDAPADAPIPYVRAHHGSVSLQVRQETERDLKQGRIQAVVATASLELGIDMGAVDLVCQVESTGNVARGLQRVGRAGHLVGCESKGRLIPKTSADLLDQAVLAAEMAAGNVEAMRVPVNCLDVLAQQIVAMVAMESWKVADLLHVLRRAYPYRDLTPAALDAVLEMVSGRFRLTPANKNGQADGPAKPPPNPATSLAALQPRISWDRVHHRLEALPGSQRLALMGGGTIPDTGQFAVVTAKGLRIGEVDEEFVWERRVGEAFLLGTNAWRISDIGTDRVTVAPAAGAPAMVPFWRGEMAGRTFDLGEAEGRFLQLLSDKLDDPDCLDWLKHECFLDSAAAHNLRLYVRRQKQRTGFVPHDRLIAVEASRDPLGDWQVVLLSPLGARVHLTLRLAIENLLRRRLGYRPQCLHHDNGIVFRLTDSAEPVLDIFEGLSAENLRDLVLDELADSALFALRFRQNAARALLIPRGQAGKRAPLWLQRLRSRDLLQVARRFPSFPVVAETFRECLDDHLDVPHTHRLLTDISAGRVQIRSTRLEAPSPFAAGILFTFQMEAIYEWDEVEADPGRSLNALDQELLDQLVSADARRLPLDPRAINQVERRLRSVGRPPRSTAETAEWLRRLGDASASDVEEPVFGFLQELVDQGRAQRIRLFGVSEPERWILTEEAELYQQAFAESTSAFEDKLAAGEKILARYLETHALVGLDDVLHRYPFERAWAKRCLEEWASSGRLVRIETPEAVQWSEPTNYAQVQRATLAVLRREVAPCSPTQFADFLVRWQGVHPAEHARFPDLAGVFERLQACFLPAELWEQTVLPVRLESFDPRRLDETLAAGDWLWLGRGADERGPGEVAFLSRETVGSMSYLAGAQEGLDDISERVMEALRRRGALFVPDIAQETNLSPNQVRRALWTLVRSSLVTNDSFAVVRRGEDKPAETNPETNRLRRPVRVGALMRGTSIRPPRSGPRPEGRWSLVPWEAPDVEADAVLKARLLLNRYGIVARELALLDGSMPRWRVLYEVLSRLELTCQVRRGYFVEGLSGAQFALPDALRRLQELGGPSQLDASLILLHSLDPANVYGSGAPFDIPLLADGTRPFLRRPGNWLVLRAGRPALLIEQHGKRLTALPTIPKEELANAVALFPRILSKNQLKELRYKLVVETWNEHPVTKTEGKALLEAAGFVRDYQAMAWYEKLP